MTEFHIRAASPDDIPALEALIEKSVRALHVADYSAAQIEGALGTVLGLDTQLIADGTYFVVEARREDNAATIVGCGGWSRRKTLFGSDHRSGREDRFLEPRSEPAKIRAFFIHPDWVRRGLGTRILEACEAAAMQSGFRAFELGATLAGERLFRARGYAPTERIEVPLVNGESVPVIRMHKSALR